MKSVAVIIPCYNEELSLPHLVEALEQVRKQLSKKVSIDFLLVNDGSTDGTQKIIGDFCTTDHIKYIEFAANAGHQSAIRAGINKAVGYDAAIMMDADMQHPPALLPEMIDKWLDGAKIVQMVRKDTRADAGAFKYATSKAYYKLLNLISDLNLEYGESDFRLIDQTVTHTVANSREKDLFLRGYFSWLKVPKVYINYVPEKRIAGQSKYTFRKMMDLAYKGILQFSIKPLKIAMAFGSILAILSLIYGAYLIIGRISGLIDTVSGWTSLMVVVLLCFGFNFLLIGILGTYLAHMLSLEKQRPEYIIASEKIADKFKGE